jgi:hypothetical protein
MCIDNAFCSVLAYLPVKLCLRELLLSHGGHSGIAPGLASVPAKEILPGQCAFYQPEYRTEKKSLKHASLALSFTLGIVSMTL